jgi:hypothetical protein
MWLVVIALLTLGFVFLAREAEATAGVRKAIKGRAAERTLEGERTPATTARPLDRSMSLVARFLDALLECSPCVSAWASMPALALYWTIGQLNDVAAAVVILLVVGPVCSVGLLYLLTLLSPTQAMGAALVGLARFKKIDEKEGHAAKDPKSDE